MIAPFHKALLGWGLLVVIVVPVAVATFPLWEWRILCWLDKRRKRREAQPPRMAVRGLR
jgi:hypothetical protein